MNVKIDQDGCIECGACEQTCSEVFVVESGQKASIVEKYRKNTSDVGEIPDILVSCTNDAVASCPVQVISTG
ncbi:4Fe-4S single cluster domain of Ferredoxin I [uncultured archaeon]|nr:4Fe-4S single cluster domain of Ferredoxin I [uncultured archaeon]